MTARHERDALGRTVQYTPPERWEEPSPRENRRVKDVLAHLAASDVAAAALVAGEEATEAEEYRKSLDGAEFTADAWHDWSVERRRDSSPVSVAAEWGQAADLFLVRVGKASNEDWHDREIPWVSGEIRLKYFVQARVAEWWVHGEDIREGGRLPPRREHWPIHAVNDLAIRLIPYCLSQAGFSFGEKTVQIDLDGVGEGSWLQSTAPGDTDPGRKADAYIDGQGYAFASVAGGRADPDFCLYEGLLNTGGEADVAEAVLHTLRSWP
jgi:uncharacterized protein (TIGR03083 family)